MKDLEFYGNDPGAVKFGNFINYYSFHSAQQRINNLDPQMFPYINEHEDKDSYICLDIGCNSGELTKELFKYLTSIYPDKSIYILAIDIDPVLITRAKESSNNNNITYTCLDVTSNDAQSYMENYIKKFNILVFDVTFCFSVTMWIHLNRGDDGLLAFLQLMKNISDTIIIEPQPWNCYRSAQRRVKKSGCGFSLYGSLKMRSEVAEEIVNFMTQSNYSKIFVSSNSSWNRNIFSFKKNVCAMLT